MESTRTSDVVQITRIYWGDAANTTGASGATDAKYTDNSHAYAHTYAHTNNLRHYAHAHNNVVDITVDVVVVVVATTPIVVVDAIVAAVAASTCCGCRLA